MSRESGWLIERLDRYGNTEAYLWAELSTGHIVDGGFRWIPTVEGAIRFSRERDALCVLYAIRRLQQSVVCRDLFHGLVHKDENIRVAEHAWMDGHVEVLWDYRDPRPEKRPDGFPTRSDMTYWSPAEKAIQDAVDVVEGAGASIALTDAVVLLAQARGRVADHMEGKP